MTQLIRDGQAISGSDSTSLIPLEEYLAGTNAEGCGVFIDSHEEVEVLEGKLHTIPVIALNFPVFSDGRAYSSAIILRRRYGYQGEVRATGDVRLDQLEQMQRCGFNAYELDDSINLERALGSLSGFSFSYQTTVDRHPLYRERTS